MQCPKPDCMYLHELGDEAASFTKEEMQVKHLFIFLKCELNLYLFAVCVCVLFVVYGLCNNKRVKVR